MRTRIWLALLLLLILPIGMCSCARENQIPPELEFQGIHWNSDSGAVFTALGLDKAELKRKETEEDPIGRHFIVTVEDWEIFGQTAVTAYFRFDNFTPDTSDYFGLTGIQIFYPEGCNQKVIVDNLRRMYGPEAQKYTLYNIVDGKAEARQYSWETGKFSWFSQKLVGDVLSDSGKVAYRRALGEISDEAFEACLSAPVASIGWTEDYYGQFESPQNLITDEGAVSWLNFNGTAFAIMLQKFA